ncbi:hypothetical protein HPP92_015724 [Vanilla planifolia]|uniref:Uncharacterized protein n=1 Tax=Vanilla planifolia TaxID=51239 RepID=A0A835QGT2_VANPL|nr:hypothetical protein HPP92_015724 [Vanilla planifolia]
MENKKQYCLGLCYMRTQVLLVSLASFNSQMKLMVSMTWRCVTPVLLYSLFLIIYISLSIFFFFLGLSKSVDVQFSRLDGEAVCFILLPLFEVLLRPNLVVLRIRLFECLPVLRTAGCYIFKSAGCISSVGELYLYIIYKRLKS